jgi:alpha-mannosidase
MPTSPSRKTVHLVCNAHLDPVWLWPWEEGLTESLATFRTAADFCEEFSSFVFNHNESILYRWVQRYEPSLFERIQKLVDAGRWHIAGGAFLQPDVNHPSGECHIRQFLYGLDYFGEHFGARPTVAYNFDPFGHPEGFAQVLACCGMKAYIFCRPGVPTLELPRGAFVWRDRDGSEVLARRSDDHYLTRPGRGGIENPMGLENKIRGYLEHYKDEPVTMLLWGIGNHGGGPSRLDWDALQRVEPEISEARFVHSTPEAFFDDLRESGYEAPTRRGEIEGCFPGCYTSMSRLKRAYRRADEHLQRLEMLAALAWWCDGETYPEQAIDDAWRDVMFNTFHDILPGSGIESVEADAIDSLGGVYDRIRRLRLELLLGRLKGEPRAADDQTPVYVHNPNGHASRRVVEFEVYEGHTPVERPSLRITRDNVAVEHQPLRAEHNLGGPMIMRAAVCLDLQPFEIARLDVGFVASPESETRAPAAASAKDLTLRSRDATYRISPETGLIESIELSNRRDSLVGPAAFCPVFYEDLDHSWTSGDPKHTRFEGFVETAPGWSEPSHRFRLATREELHALSPLPVNKWQHGDKPVVGETLQVVEDGPLRTTIEAVFVSECSTCFRQYVFDRPTGRLTLRDRYFINHRDVMLKLHVPLGSEAASSYSESLFSVAERSPSDLHEDRHNQRWVAVSAAEDGATLGVVNNGSFGHSLTKRELGINVLRTPAYASFIMRPEHPHHAHRFTPRQDQGEHRAEFTLVPQPHFNELELTRAADELNVPSPHVSFFPSGSGLQSAMMNRTDAVLSVQPSEVQVTAVKKAKRGDNLILRLRETLGQRTQARVTLNDQEIGPVELQPHELVTLSLHRTAGGETAFEKVNAVEGL